MMASSLSPDSNNIRDLPVRPQTPAQPTSIPWIPLWVPPASAKGREKSPIANIASHSSTASKRVPKAYPPIPLWIPPLSAKERRAAAAQASGSDPSIDNEHRIMEEPVSHRTTSFIIFDVMRDLMEISKGEMDAFQASGAQFQSHHNTPDDNTWGSSAENCLSETTEATETTETTEATAVMDSQHGFTNVTEDASYRRLSVKRYEWTSQEEKVIKDLPNPPNHESSTRHWQKVSEMVPRHPPSSCRQKWMALHPEWSERDPGFRRTIGTIPTITNKFRYPRFNHEQDAVILQLRDEGAGSVEMARAIGFTDARACMKRSYALDKKRRDRKERSRSQLKWTRKRWTEAEKARLIRLRFDGMYFSAIAKELGGRTALSCKCAFHELSDAERLRLLNLSTAEDGGDHEHDIGNDDDDDDDDNDGGDDDGEEDFEEEK